MDDRKQRATLYVQGLPDDTPIVDISDFNKKKAALMHCTAEVKTNSPTLLFVDI